MFFEIFFDSYKLKISYLLTITVDQSSMLFFSSLLFKIDRILRNDGLFSLKHF